MYLLFMSNMENLDFYRKKKKRKKMIINDNALNIAKIQQYKKVKINCCYCYNKRLPVYL